MRAVEVVGDWLALGVVHGTVLAAITGVLALTVLRRARPALLAALWLVVLVKFLVPVGPGWSLSLSSALDQATGRSAAEPAAALGLASDASQAAPAAASA